MVVLFVKLPEVLGDGDGGRHAVGRVVLASA